MEDISTGPVFTRLQLHLRKLFMVETSSMRCVSPDDIIFAAVLLPELYVDHASCQDTRRSTSGSIQLLGDRLVSWSSKRQKSAAIPVDGSWNILLCPSAIALCCNNALHSRIQAYRHKISSSSKSMVVNGVIEPVYFVNGSIIGGGHLHQTSWRERIDISNQTGWVLRSFYAGDSEKVCR
ncbi:hypothetical protein Tco_0335175 [Tanacetum coccineum]